MSTQASLARMTSALEKGGGCQPGPLLAHSCTPPTSSTVKSNAVQGFRLAAGCSLIKRTAIVYGRIKFLSLSRRLSSFAKLVVIRIKYFKRVLVLCICIHGLAVSRAIRPKTALHHVVRPRCSPGSGKHGFRYCLFSTSL
jgi:hypothetical protein